MVVFVDGLVGVKAKHLDGKGGGAIAKLWTGKNLGNPLIDDSFSRVQYLRRGWVGNGRVCWPEEGAVLPMGKPSEGAEEQDVVRK